MRDIDFRQRSLEDFFELWRNSTEIKSLGIFCDYGDLSKGQPHSLPHARWSPSSDTFDRGGFGKAVDTFLPLRPGEPAAAVTATAIWTRSAGVDIWLYPSAVTTLQTMIDATLLALENIFGVSGNYSALTGRNALKDDYQTESDGYALSIVIKIPTFRLQPRHTAGSTEITQEVP